MACQAGQGRVKALSRTGKSFPIYAAPRTACGFPLMTFRFRSTHRLCRGLRRFQPHGVKTPQSSVPRPVPCGATGCGTSHPVPADCGARSPGHRAPQLLQSAFRPGGARPARPGTRRAGRTPRPRLRQAGVSTPTPAARRSVFPQGRPTDRATRRYARLRQPTPFRRARALRLRGAPDPGGGVRRERLQEPAGPVLLPGRGCAAGAAGRARRPRRGQISAASAARRRMQSGRLTCSRESWVTKARIAPRARRARSRSGSEPGL